jgi:hypothetical protein
MITRGPTRHRALSGRPLLRRRALRAGAVLAVPLVAYFVIRPLVSSDAAALALAGVIPLAYQVVLVLWRRRIDAWALVSGIGFALGCLASLFAGGISGNVQQDQPQ